VFYVNLYRSTSVEDCAFAVVVGSIAIVAAAKKDAAVLRKKVMLF